MHERDGVRGMARARARVRARVRCEGGATCEQDGVRVRMTYLRDGVRA